MKNFSKALFGTVAAGAMALAGATPAVAADRYNDRDRGIDTGDIIAGAAVLGGIAILAGALGNDRDQYRDQYRDRRYRDRNYRDDRSSRRDNSRRAVERCVRTAERQARRAGYRYADVTQIRDVDRTRYGYRVKGRMVVEDGRRGYRNSRYDRQDRRYRQRDLDQGRFTCIVERGQRPSVRYRGINGLR